MNTKSAPPPCPNEAGHTPRPRGYVAWHEWAEKMAETHKQERCPSCGLWMVWVPKVPGALVVPVMERRCIAVRWRS